MYVAVTRARRKLILALHRTTFEAAQELVFDRIFDYIDNNNDKTMSVKLEEAEYDRILDWARIAKPDWGGEGLT